MEELGSGRAEELKIIVRWEITELKELKVKSKIAGSRGRAVAGARHKGNTFGSTELTESWTVQPLSECSSKEVIVYRDKSGELD